jgi:hypothetical protein
MDYFLHCYRQFSLDDYCPKPFIESAFLSQDEDFGRIDTIALFNCPEFRGVAKPGGQVPYTVYFMAHMPQNLIGPKHLLMDLHVQGRTIRYSFPLNEFREYLGLFAATKQLLFLCAPMPRFEGVEEGKFIRVSFDALKMQMAKLLKEHGGFGIQVSPRLGMVVNSLMAAEQVSRLMQTPPGAYWN